MKSITVFVLALCFSLSAIGQRVPQGMNFQAVARNPAGEILSSLELTLKVNLMSVKTGSSVSYYTETHSVTTNEIGLFSVVIGSGSVQAGKIDLVPWSTEDIYIELSIKEKSQATYFAVDTSKLLTVPYAFHAGTADKTTGTTTGTGWSLKGNAGLSSATDKLGTTDSADLVLVTNNVQRLRLTAAGLLQVSKLADSTVAGNRMVVTNSKGELFAQPMSGLSGSTMIKAGSNVVVTGLGTGSDPYIINSIDSAASTKVLAGLKISVTGSGTTANPYIINSTDTSTSTKLTAGANVTINGVGTAASPYIISSSDNGSSTKVTPGLKISVSGTGTTANPYIINSTDTTGPTRLAAGSNITINGTGTAASPYVISSTDSGSSTKILAGASVTVTGTGTTANPYIINASATSGGESTKLQAGLNVSITGAGTSASPYVINSSDNGSSTKILAGTKITVTGSGTISSPYVINSSDSSGVTKLAAGSNVTITGSGSTANPYVINSADSGTSTRISPGSNVTVTGTGSTLNPYVINANGSLASPLSAVLNAGTSSDKNIQFTNNDHDFIEVVPANYDPNLGQGKFTMAIKEFQGVNDGDTRSNVVGSFWGYNTNPGGGQQIPNEASYRFAGETHYVTSSYPGLYAPSFEFHIPEVYTNNGSGLRPFSMYIDKETGLGSANYQMHNFNFKTVADANKDWMTMKLDADNVRIEITPQASSATSTIKMYNGQGNFAELISNDGLSFRLSSGSYHFNSNIYAEGQLFAATIRGVSNNTTDNWIAHQFTGRSENRSLLSVGDEINSERFYVKPGLTVNTQQMLVLNDMIVSGSFRAYDANELTFRSNILNTGAGVSFIDHITGATTARFTRNGVNTTAIQTERPSNASSAGVLKVGKVVSGTVTAVTNKYLQIEIDGVNYKLALVE